MKTTALYLSSAGAQRVTVDGFADASGKPDPEGTHAAVTDRDGTHALVERSLLMNFLEEDDSQ